MAAQYVVVALKVENIHSGWLSSGKLVAPKEDNIQSSRISKGMVGYAFYLKICDILLTEIWVFK